MYCGLNGVEGESLTLLGVVGEEGPGAMAETGKSRAVFGK